MKLVLAILAATLGCSSEGSGGPRPPVQCGGQTCAEGQLCATITAGHVCDTNPDAGIGEYSVLRVYCMTPPAACGAHPDCECIGGCSLATGEGRPCLSVTDDHVSCGCF